MNFENLSPDMCAILAREMFKKETGYTNKTNTKLDEEICSSLIGTTYNVCSELWNHIDPLNNLALQELHPKIQIQQAHPKHLFWALLFLKCYCTEPILTRLVGGVDNKTFRKWSWAFVDGISLLKQRIIKLENRFMGWDGLSVCLISVDGMDCAIQEIWPFDKEIFSEKMNGPGYKYEIGVCIKTGWIVWVNGPFKAGRSDKTIFAEDGLKAALCDDEGVEVDARYQGDDQLKNPSVAQSREDRKQKGKVRARHENVNGCLKKFDVLNGIFRHDPKEKHGTCFNAVAVITQLQFELEGGLYSVDYNARYD